jgi:hypothetical protein
MKKDRELDYLNRFKSLYENFPSGEILESEQPDFIVESKRGKIGIELTELFQDSHLRGYSKFQQESSSRHLFTNELIAILQNYVSFTFHIGIEFNEFKPVNKLNKTLILKKAFRATINRISNLENKQMIEISDFKILPEQINSIHIGRFDGLKESYDEMPEGGTVSDIENIHIESILEKKHKKLKKYQNCSEQWLLIREGNYYAGSFADFKITKPIDTLFDKIFILRSNYNKIIELK